MSRGDEEQLAAADGERYLAFISYSHADEKIAASTHRFLERFRVPRELVGEETENGAVPARIRPVFRDQDEFPASADLGRAIRGALSASRTLVVICSPRSAASRWVGEEIRYFKKIGRGERIYCLTVAGDPVAAGSADNARAAFHPALLEGYDGDGQLLEAHGEPLAVDLADGGLSTAGVRLAAGVLGVGYDDLYRRVRRQKMRRRSVLAAAATMVLAVVGWFAWDAARERQLNAAQQLARQAREELYDADPLSGLALALHAVAVAPTRDGDGREPILAVARDLAARARIAGLGDDVETVVANADGSRLIVDHAQGSGELRAGADGALLQTLSALSGSADRAQFPDGAPGYFIAGGELRLAADGTRVAELKSPVSRLTLGPGYFFVEYDGWPAELRRLADGDVVPLAEGARIAAVAFGEGGDASLMAVEYYGGHAPELRRTDDVSLVPLSSTPADIQLSPGADVGRLLVIYEDGHAELLRAEELLRSVDFSPVRRFDADSGRLMFLPRAGGHFIRASRSDGVHLFRSADGSSLTAGSKTVQSRARTSYVAVVAADRVEWFDGSDGARVGAAPGSYEDVVFSRDTPASRLALQHAGGWELRRVDDGSLVTDLPGTETLRLDVELFFVDRGGGDSEGAAEIRRLDDGSLMLTLEGRVAGVTYPSAGLAQLRRDDDRETLVRLSDGEAVRAPVNRVVIGDALVGPGSAYHLVQTVNGTELARSVDGAPVLSLGRNIGPDQLTFIPDVEPTHVLAPSAAGSSLFALDDTGESVDLDGAVVSIDLLPAGLPRYLLVRYADGRTEVWRGLENIRRLGPLGTNVAGFSYAASESALTVWTADGAAAVVDLEWLERATADGITTDELFALACNGRLADFDGAALAGRLGGKAWLGCRR